MLTLCKSTVLGAAFLAGVAIAAGDALFAFALPIIVLTILTCIYTAMGGITAFTREPFGRRAST